VLVTKSEGREEKGHTVCVQLHVLTFNSIIKPIINNYPSNERSTFQHNLANQIFSATQLLPNKIHTRIPDTIVQFTHFSSSSHSINIPVLHQPAIMRLEKTTIYVPIPVIWEIFDDPVCLWSHWVFEILEGHDPLCRSLEDGQLFSFGGQGWLQLRACGARADECVVFVFVFGGCWPL
jgi:hypothetical protein